MAKVTVCSKLPSGINLSLPDKSVFVAGSKVSFIDGYSRIPGETVLEERDWLAVKKYHSGQEYMKNGYIWQKTDSPEGNAEKAAEARSKETDGLDPKEIKSSKENKTKIE